MSPNTEERMERIRALYEIERQREEAGVQEFLPVSAALEAAVDTAAVRVERRDFAPF